MFQQLAAMEGTDPASAAASMIARTGIARLGEPEDIAEAIAFLAILRGAGCSSPSTEAVQLASCGAIATLCRNVCPLTKVSIYLALQYGLPRLQSRRPGWPLYLENSCPKRLVRTIL